MLIKTIEKENTSYSLFKIRGVYLIRAIKENGEVSVFINMDSRFRGKKPYFGKI